MKLWCPLIRNLQAEYKKILSLWNNEFRNSPGACDFCQVLLKRIKSKKLTTLLCVACDSQSNHLIQNLTLYYFDKDVHLLMMYKGVIIKYLPLGREGGYFTTFKWKFAHQHARFHTSPPIIPTKLSIAQPKQLFICIYCFSTVLCLGYDHQNLDRCHNLASLLHLHAVIKVTGRCIA